jgi:hypothetical protein
MNNKVRVLAALFAHLVWMSIAFGATTGTIRGTVSDASAEISQPTQGVPDFREYWPTTFAFPGIP